MVNFNRQALSAALTAGINQLDFVISEQQIAQLLDFLALLVKWNGVYNLTAIREPEQMITHHLLDTLAALLAFDGAIEVLDVGSGGGLPGIVLAIWAQQAQPEMKVSMIDTVHKKTAFLTQVKAELGLKNVTIHTGKVEQLKVDHQFDVITSRAFADLADFVQWSAYLLKDKGRFLAMKGVVPHDEIARLPKEWKVTAIHTLEVPGLAAERHLIQVEKQSRSINLG